MGAFREAVDCSASPSCDFSLRGGGLSLLGFVWAFRNPYDVATGVPCRARTDPQGSFREVLEEMNDRELREKVWQVLMNRFLKFNKSSLYSANTLSCVGHPRRGHAGRGPRHWPLNRYEKTTWTDILTSAGCEVFPYHFPEEDTEEDIFVRDVAFGNIRVPREVAMRMLVLGELP